VTGFYVRLRYCMSMDSYVERFLSMFQTLGIFFF
jgi:hypothetical protein